MIAISPSRILLLSSLLVSSSLLADQADAMSWLRCIPNYVQDKILSQSDIMKNYMVAVEDAGARFERHLEGLDHAMDDQEKENLLMKFIAEEVNKLQQRVKTNQISDKPSEANIKDVQNSLEACKVDKKIDESAWNNWNKEADLLDVPIEFNSKDQELMDQVRALEEEMGLALDDETRRRLKTRTREVLMDLLQNEVRQIAAAIVTAYASGGAGFMGIVIQYLPVIKVKIVQYLMNTVIDLVRAAMGTHIEIEQPPVQPPVEPPLDEAQAQMVLAN